MINKPTVHQIRKYREVHSCSLQEARKALAKQWRMEMLELARVQHAIGADGQMLLTMLEYLIELESGSD